jgi:hypothetical protein
VDARDEGFEVCGPDNPVVKARVVLKRRQLFEAHAEIRMEAAETTLLAETNATMYRIESADTKLRQEEQEDVFA